MLPPCSRPAHKVVLHGSLPADYGLLYASVGVASTFVGQTVVDYLVRACPPLCLTTTAFRCDSCHLFFSALTLCLRLLLLFVRCACGGSPPDACQVKKYKKDAVVVLVIGAVMCVALVLMGGVGALSVVEAGGFTSFAPLCG